MADARSLAGLGAPAAALARSPVAGRGPVGILAGWEVSLRRSAAALRLADWTALAKVTVRAGPATAVARALGVPHGRAAADGPRLVVGSGPDEWLLLGPPGTADELVRSCPRGGDDELVTVLDASSARALLRLTGETAAAALAKVCAIDLHDSRCPTGSAFSTSVAGVVTGVVRDDLAGERSYLLHCDRSYGQFLFDALLDAGQELDVDVEGLSLGAGWPALPMSTLPGPSAALDGDVAR